MDCLFSIKGYIFFSFGCCCLCCDVLCALVCCVCVLPTSVGDTSLRRMWKSELNSDFLCNHMKFYLFIYMRWKDPLFSSLWLNNVVSCVCRWSTNTSTWSEQRSCVSVRSGSLTFSSTAVTRGLAAPCPIMLLHSRWCHLMYPMYWKHTQARALITTDLKVVID